MGTDQHLLKDQGQELINHVLSRPTRGKKGNEDPFYGRVRTCTMTVDTINARLAEKEPASPKPKVINPEAGTGNHNAGKAVIDVGLEVANEPPNKDSAPSDD